MTDDMDEVLDATARIKLLLNNREPSKKMLKKSESNLEINLTKLSNVNNNISAYRIFLNISNFEFDLFVNTAKVMSNSKSFLYNIILPTSYDYDELNGNLQNDLSDIANATNLNQFLTVLKDMINNNQDEDLKFYKAISLISKNLIKALPNILKSL